ncbi:MAG: glycoside hydrolase family 3 N-terminal domain-containing protein [Crocinitomicaceae bacterium]
MNHKKNFWVTILCILSISIIHGQNRFTSSDKIEKKIDKLISKMSVTEKVGQTCQITLDAILAVDKNNKPLEPLKIDEVKLAEALDKYKVGSMLNVSSHTLSLDEWETVFSAVNAPFLNGTSDIPIIYGVDAIHGVNYTKKATLFPQEIGLAATWNKDLAKKFGEITAYETRASGIRWNFSPVLDVARQPLWSRYFETLGEDPYLASEMGREIVLGYQGSEETVGCHHVAACLKHFVGYSMPQSGRDRTPAWIPEKYMTEIYLPPFKTAIDAGAMTLMINSGDVNGIPGHTNKALLTDLLKNRWGFKGFTVSDWEDFIMLETVHNVAKDAQEAIVSAINAGVDMSMVPLAPHYKTYCDLLKKSVEEGKVSTKRLDDAVRRILRVKFATELFDKKTYEEMDYPLFGGTEFKMAAHSAALESITLLKNNANILPLNKSAKVLVAGPAANSLTNLNGAWTHTWQGVDSNYNSKGFETIYEAIAKKVGAANCNYSEGVKMNYIDAWENSVLADIEDFKMKAKSSDIIVLCLGELPSTEKPGDIRSLRLPQAQLDLAKIAFETGKKVVLVMVEARPRVIHEIVEGSAAIIQAYLPGDPGGKALADIIFGDVNPSGKLPYTYPKYDGIFEFYDHPRSVDRSGKTYQFDAFDPEWEFGYGLSYTSFSYSNLRVNEKKITSEGTITVEVTVENTGDKAGKEVVQLYLSDEKASMVPAGKRLVRFEKIDLLPHESKTIKFIINFDDLKFSDSQGNWITEPGMFNISIKDASVQFEAQ